jgi:hypothetical protein
MSKSESKQKYFPLKPKTEEGFKEPVSWLGGRELVSSLKGMLIYSIYGESIDPRPWMKPNPYPAVSENGEVQIDKEVADAWAKKDAEYWDWKRTRFEFWEEYLNGKPLPNTKEQGEFKEFWFDYIADTGDGQRGVYGVGCLCLSDLWLTEDKTGAAVNFKVADATKETLLPRGSFLFIGGDTAYHVADYSSIHERFQTPFRWAFASVREFMIKHYGLTANAEKYFISERETIPILIEGKFNEKWDGTLSKRNPNDPDEFWDTEPLRPIFGVPANHDYYDDLDGFNRLFRRPPFETVEENRIDPKYSDALPLKIPTFKREQEASYTALRLPFGWWFLGIDSENEKLDFRQRVFFKQVLEKWRPKKIIVSTPEPTTVFGRKCAEDDKTATYVKAITESIGLQQPFLNDGKFSPIKTDSGEVAVERGEYCRLDLSGDVHHYARYWGPENKDFGQKEHASENYASLVAGGGGAFFDSTGTLIGKSKVTKNGKQETVAGEIPPQIAFPDKQCSERDSADRIFDLWNIRKGGYVQIAGAIIAVIISFSLTGGNISETGGNIYGFFQNVGHKIIAAELDGWTTGAALLASLGFFAVSGYLLHKLIIKLKDGRYEKNSGESDNGRIRQLRVPIFCFVFGLLAYVFLFLAPHWQTGESFLQTLHPYAKSFLLLLHLVGVGLLVWLSIEYSNWLLLRFKFVRQSGEKPDGWLNLIFNASFIEKIDNLWGERDTLLKRIVETYKKQTVENVPIFVLNICAVAMLILAIYLFGNRQFSEIGVDLVFTAIVLGGLAGLTYFAFSTGASHQKGINKFGFVLIGLWHALLQLLTPFILVYYADWRFVIFVVVLTVFTNGFSGAHAMLKFLFLDIDDPKTTGWKKALWRLLTMRFGAWLMKRGNAYLLAVAWVIYGLIVLVTPLLLFKYVQPSVQSINNISNLLIEPNVRSIGNIVNSFVGKYLPSTSSWLPVVILLLIVAYLGYRMSRVWFSWYLAVSLLFNGHNNEAGGAARIQGYKHILRIKVEKDKLTVYVIGFDDAEIELDDLEPRLVDKFELKSTPLG